MSSLYYYNLLMLCCQGKNGGGGGNRTRVRSNVQFKSFTGLSCLFPKQEKICDAPPTPHRHGVPPDTDRGYHFDFLFSLESTSYSLLGNEVSEDPASYAAKATAWK